MQDHQNENFITTKIAGDLFGYTQDYLARLARSGKILGKRVGHAWLIEEKSAERFFNENQEQKANRTRALSDVRGREYWAHRSIAGRVSTPPMHMHFVNAPTAGIDTVSNTVRIRLLAGFVACAVLFVGSLGARASVLSDIVRQTTNIGEKIALGFEVSFGAVPSHIAERFFGVHIAMRVHAPYRSLGWEGRAPYSSIIPLALVDLSRIQMTPLAKEYRTPFRFSVNVPRARAVVPRASKGDVAGVFRTVYGFSTNPDNARDVFMGGYLALGTRGYALVTDLFSGYTELVIHSGVRLLSFASVTRDLFVRAPALIRHTNLAFGQSIVEVTYQLIRADVSLAYGLAAAAPASADITVAFINRVGAGLIGATHRTPAHIVTLFLHMTAVPANVAPRLAQTVFAGEYLVASRFIVATRSISDTYLAFLDGVGDAVYESGHRTLAVARLIKMATVQVPSALEDTYLGTLGKTALVLGELSRVPSIASLELALEGVVTPALAAAEPALSAAQKVALTTYQTIHGLFDSTTSSLAVFFTPSVSEYSRVITASDKRTAAPPASSHTTPIALTSYPTYTTIVKGVSQDSVDQSLAALRGDVLATVARMIQPVAAQTATNVTTIQQVNMIQNLSDLIVHNGSFHGGTFDGGSLTNGVTVTAATGRFGNLIGGETALGTTTVTGPLVVNGVTITSSGGGTWGTITGTLSTQTDLQNALNAKFSLADWYATTSAPHITTLANLVYATTTNLNIGNTITGAGLATCSGSNDKLLWDSATQRFACGVDAGSSGGLTGLGAQYSSYQVGSTQTFATSSDTNIGLIITSSANTHTFTPTWIGTLADARITSSANWNTAYASRITSATYPLLISANSISSAFGTTTSNTWGGTQTFTNTPTLGTLTGLIAGNSGTLYQVASSSLFGFTPVSNALAKGNFLVGNDAGTAQATSTIFISSLGSIGIGSTTPSNLLSVQGNSYYSGTAFFGGALTATSTLNVTGLTTLGNASTTQLTVSGTASTTALVISGLGNGAAQCLQIDAVGVVSATGSACGSGSGSVNSVANSDSTLTISPTTGSVVASLNLTHPNTWTGLQQFNSNASTTQLTATGSTYLATSGGNVGIATTSPLSLFSIGTAGNAFRVDTTGTVKEGIWNGSPIGLSYGGTGLSSLSGNQILYTNSAGTSFAQTATSTLFGTATGGNILAWVNGTPQFISTTTIPIAGDVGGTLSATAIGANKVTVGMLAQAGANTLLGNVTGSTGNVTAISTSTLNIGGTASNVTGTVAVANGGTGLSSFTANSILYSNATGNALAFAATSSLFGFTPVSNALAKGNFLVGNDAGTAQATSTIFISSLGSIGIGTTSPSNLFSVQGNSYNSGTAFFGGALTATSTLNVTGLTTLGNASTTQLTTTGATYLATSGGNVGIATTSPWAKLAINPIAGNGNSFVIGSSTATNFIVTNAGNVGIGSTSPTSLLSVQGSVGPSDVDAQTVLTVTGGKGGYISSNPAAKGGAIILTAGDGGDNGGAGPGGIGGDIIMNPGAGGSGSSAGAPGNIILANLQGSVGIGTTTPWAKLSVNPNGITGPAFAIGSSTATNFIVTNAGRIGIATSSPGSLLSIQGIVNFTTATTTFYGNGINIPANQCYAVNGICLSTSGSNYFTNSGDFTYLSTGSNLGIGTTSPFATLSVAGNGFFNGTLTASNITATGTLSVIGNTTLGTLTGLVAGNNGLLYQVASSSLFGFTPVSNALAKGNFLVGDDAGTAQATSTIFISSLGSIGIGTTTPVSRLDLVSSATSSAAVTLRDPTGNVALELRASTSTLQNTYLGIEAGRVTTSGASNTAVGYQNLYTNTSGLQNTAIGYQTLYSNINGASNTGTGFKALYTNGSGGSNTAAGYSSLFSNTSGSNNTATGYSSLYSNSTGSYNTGTGYKALYSGTSGFYNIGIGYQAGYNVSSGYDNIMIGDIANTGGNNITTGWNNIGIGYNAGIGTSTNATNFLNIGNSFFGTMVATSSSTSLPTDYSQAKFGVGSSSPWAMLSVNPTVGMAGPAFAIGSSTATNFVVMSSGYVGIGTTTPYAQLSVSNLVAGANFNADNATATSTFLGGLNVGNGSLNYSWGSGETSIGSLIAGTQSFDTDAGMVQWTDLPVSMSIAGVPQSYTASIGGNPMIMVYGYATGGSASTTYSNGVAIGSSTPPSAMFSVFGRSQTSSTTVEFVNSASTTLFKLLDSGLAGFGTTTPWAQLSVNPNALGSGVPEFAIGSSSASHLIVTGAGNVGIGTTSPDMLLAVGSATPTGSVAHFENSTGSCYINPTTTSLTCTSDARLKTNVNTLSDTSGLDTLSQLRPVTYNWKNGESIGDPVHTGFIAQEVQAVMPDLVMEAPDGYLTMNYAGLTPYLVKGVQELKVKFVVPSEATTSPAVLTADGKSIDLYKLATFTLGNVQILSDRVDAQEVRLTSLESRMTALESGAVSSASGSPIALSTSTLASALSGFGVLIEKGIAQFNTLVFRQLVASKDADGTSSAGSVSIITGNTVAQVNNSLVKTSTKVFITFNTQVTGTWWVSDKTDGSFRVVLSAPQPTDMSFDYFLVQTEGQMATSTPVSVSQSSGPDTVAPVITLLGDNPVHVSVGGVFTDSGVTVADNADGIDPVITFINGIQQEVSTTTIDTASPTTYLITYQATDKAGNITTARRSVIIGNPDGTVSTDTSGQDPRGSTSLADTTAPVVSLIGSAAMSLTVGDTFTDPGATAIDDTDGDMTAKIAVTGTVDTATAGVYTLTYKATDIADNTGAASRLVAVSSEPTSVAPSTVPSPPTVP